MTRRTFQRIQRLWKWGYQTRLNALWAIPAGIIVGELLYRLAIAGLIRVS